MVVPSFQATDDVNDWFRVNYLSKAMHLSSILWRYIFPFVVWELWKHRNKVVFEKRLLLWLSPYSSLLFDCRLLLEKIPHYTVKHVFRGANRSADALARMGCNL